MVGANKWLIISDVIKRRGIPTKESAEKEIDKMMENSETDDTETELIIHRPKFQTKASVKHVIPQYNVSTSLPKLPALSSALINKGISTESAPTTPKSTISIESPATTPKTTLNQKQNLVPNADIALSSPLLSTSQLADIDDGFSSQFFANLNGSHTMGSDVSNIN